MKKLALTITIGLVILTSLACVVTTSQTPTSGQNGTNTPHTATTPIHTALPRPSATTPLIPTITIDHGLGHIVAKSCKTIASLGDGMDCGISIMNADGSDMRQLTYGEGDTQPSRSPDGTRVVFISSKRDGNYEIYLIHTDGSGFARLTNTPGMELQPSWSPDGNQIIYISSIGLTVMGADGSNPHSIANPGGVFPHWSPDGRQILSLTGDMSNILTIMDADGTHVRVIHTEPLYEASSPVMSPDGSKIAFLTQKNNIDSLVEVDVIDIDGKNQRSLTDGYQLTYGGVSWSPDGQQLIFTMAGDGKRSQDWPPAQLYIVNADGSGLHKLDTSCVVCVWADWGH